MTTLLSPGVNLLGVNASYIPDGNAVNLERIRARHRECGLPPLLAMSATAPPLPGAREVARLRVGLFHPPAFPEGESQAIARRQVLVEQVSRLHLAEWSRVLAQAHGTPDWAAGLARHLARRLESASGYVLLLAYRDTEAVGSLLWQAGHAHLWGATPDAARPLLQAACALDSPGEPLTFSALPESGSLPSGTPEVVYALLDE